MQVFRLPRHVTRGAALKRWRRARDNGLGAAAAAAAVGVSRATLYRWRKLHDQGRLAPRSRRPRRPRRPEWSPQLAAAVHEMRADFPMWGKAKLTILLRRQGYAASQSTVGRILKKLLQRGAVTPVPTLRRKAPRRSRKHSRPHARRLPKGRKPTAPGEIVQLDTLSLSPGHGRPALKQFTACGPVAKWTCAQAYRRATAHNAKRFLDKLQDDMPFPIQAITDRRLRRRVQHLPTTQRTRRTYPRRVPSIPDSQGNPAVSYVVNQDRASTERVTACIKEKTEKVAKGSRAHQYET